MWIGPARSFGAEGGKRFLGGIDMADHEGTFFAALRRVDFGKFTVPNMRAPPHSPATTTRSNLGFELSPRVRSSKMLIRNPAPEIASLAPQTKLPIEDERIRRHPIPALQEASPPLLRRVSLRLNCLRKTCARKRRQNG